METVDYATRADLVSAIVDARKRGVHVEVVHNGLTLKFPDGLEGVGSTPEDEKFGEEQQAPADGIEKTPVEGDTLLGVVGNEEEPLDRSTFTAEGTCSECGQAAIADEDGSWVHVDPATHGDNAGEFVPNEPAVEGEQEDEDLIGEAQAPQQSPAKRKRSR